MILLWIVVTAYLVVGFFYALRILIIGSSRWYAFPVNWMGGPIIMVYTVYLAYTGKKPPYE